MADSISKLAGMLESARELTLEAASSASARLMDDALPKTTDISAMLNSRSERERLSGMKHVVSIMAKGGDASEFFPDVIKNIASSNIEVRKLVYVYLLKYAEFQPDLALLSINTIQKSLTNQNPFVRSLAIRVMSSIKVPVIVPIVNLAIKQLSHDPASLVRRATVQALGNVVELEPGMAAGHVDVLAGFLVDSDPSVSGTAVAVLARHFPDRIDLLHPCFRRLCNSLPEFDEWAQIMALDVLTKYGRMFLSPASIEGKITKSDKDLDLLFQKAALLLYSKNGAVVVGTAKLFFYLGTREIFASYKVAGYVIRLLRSEPSVQYVVLMNIRIIALQYPSVFSEFIGYFLLFPDDNADISSLKLDILTLLSNDDNISIILSELRTYALISPDPKIVSASVQAMARCVMNGREMWQQKTLRWLLKEIKGDNPVLVSESLTTIRFLIQRDVKNHSKTLTRVAKSLGNAKNPKARASIIWLVGEYAHLIPQIAADVLRVCAKSFLDEEESVRYQIILLAAKLYCQVLSEFGGDVDGLRADNSRIPLLFDYIMNMAKLDTSYDNRDRTRLLTSLLGSSLNKDIATLVLQAPKPSPVISLTELFLPSNESSSLGSIKPGELLIGSSSLLIGSPLDGYQSLPQWTPEDQLIDQSVRDEAIKSDGSTQQHSKINGSARAITNTKYSKNSTKRFDEPESHGIIPSVKKLREQTLDEFFGDEEEEDEEEESEEEEEEEDEEEESEEEESEEEESQEEESEEKEVGGEEEREEDEENGLDKVGQNNYESSSESENESHNLLK